MPLLTQTPTTAQRALYRAIVDACYQEFMEQPGAVPSTDWADRIIDRVLKDAPRCPVCNSVHVDVCKLLGHVYPVKRKYCMCPRENHNDMPEAGSMCPSCGGVVE